MNENTTASEPVEIVPIFTVYQGESPSVSGRSVLFWELGRQSNDPSLFFRIVSSSGGGMVANLWIAANEIDAVVIGEEVLTGKSFQVLHEGRSINFGPYALGVCRDLGYVTATETNSRIFRHRPTTTFTMQAIARIEQSGEAAPKSGRKRSKEG